MRSCRSHSSWASGASDVSPRSCDIISRLQCRCAGPFEDDRAALNLDRGELRLLLRWRRPLDGAIRSDRFSIGGVID